MAYSKRAPVWRLGLFILIAVVAADGCTGGGGSSSPGPVTPWQRFRHDSANSGVGIADVGTARGTPTAIPVDDVAPLSPVSSSPAIGPDGSVYIASEAGTFKSVTSTGEKRWSINTCSVCPAGNQALGGVQASPAVYLLQNTATYLLLASTTGRLYVFTDDGTSATCTTCFDPGLADPDLQNTGLQAHFYSSPTFTTHSVTGNITAIYLGATLTGATLANPQGKLYAVSADGTFQWSYPRGTTWPAGFSSSPSLVSGTAIFVDSDEGTIHAVTPIGGLLWTATFAPFRDPTAAFAQSPVIGPSGLFANTADGHVVAMSQDGRTIAWQTTLDNIQFASSMVLSNQPPVATATPITTTTPTPTGTPVGSPSGSPVSGSPTPTPTPMASTTPTATPTAGFLSSTLFGLSKEGELVILDSRTGSTVATEGVQEAVDGQVFSSPAMSTDGYLVFGSANGTIYALNATTGVAAWTPITLAPGVSIRSSPAIANDGTIWVAADNGYLYRVGSQ